MHFVFLGYQSVDWIGFLVLTKGTDEVGFNYTSAIGQNVFIMVQLVIE